MKKFQEKLSQLFILLKGKKPLVVIVSLLVIGGATFGVQKGYISEDLVNFNVIVESVNNLLGSPTADTTSTYVDTTHSVVDTLSNN